MTYTICPGVPLVNHCNDMLDPGAPWTTILLTPWTSTVPDNDPLKSYTSACDETMAQLTSSALRGVLVFIPTPLSAFTMNCELFVDANGAVIIHCGGQSLSHNAHDNCTIGS